MALAAGGERPALPGCHLMRPKHPSAARAHHSPVGVLAGAGQEEHLRFGGLDLEADGDVETPAAPGAQKHLHPVLTTEGDRPRRGKGVEARSTEDEVAFVDRLLAFGALPGHATGTSLNARIKARRGGKGAELSSFRSRKCQAA